MQLENDVKEGFNMKKATVAVFLDVNKAYDPVWNQGLLFKLARVGVSGCLLGWLQEILSDRAVCVRVGGFVSDSRSIKTGFPQGTVISPLLFNLILIDFPTPSPGVTRLLYADDVILYTRIQPPQAAEQILQPYIDEVCR